MKKVIADKIASVAQHQALGRELRVSKDIPCEEGVLLAVEILNNKATYNKLELTSGRMAQVKQGDIIVGALGHRKALFGYSGHLPEKLAPGDEIQVLNIGGVLGICDSVNANFGQPFNAKVLGTVLEFPTMGERIGVPARAGAASLKKQVPLQTNGIPVVALAGTCMDSGKTAAACAIISRLRHLGLSVAAFKATGVALRRDILAMEDAGAFSTSIFSDYGVVTTTNKNGPAVTRTMLNELAASSPTPDVIVFELGDGILGAYGVEAILKDTEFCEILSCLVLCANDPVGATGGVDLLKSEFHLKTDLVTGPATDNEVGCDIIKKRSNVPAINGITNATELGDVVAGILKLDKS
ncbi:MAG: molybdopterin-guanine dinucleotide biosynthesis protein B [Gammaproteobacteria bacterium]|nr:molybdopterin-guanine dinucleotide biosynthesis protein B [Gammaproteobacteria bacterium]MCP4091662.1 molybdopterin-guanine dinucleotide biosynthesis protein B [Gammaproteobacteria bacterium]MCP4276158.1 molybdopterin-guanine dinucleotide biosynthesis protein B [Gammaproteobacteria bacterium]MCP4831792.1 molybdopterin-guanine dinucleotide biosynthesis protein B [Gammaproteobacteria bacterium]MCP4929728.1 molybdopterin-guanine dinucleotide biosynthesis protein B [Gammaproteobacteria bacterium